MLSIELRDEDDHWYQSRRVNDLRRAYTVGRHDTPDEVRRVTGYAISELLAGILPALLEVCLVQATATALGAVVGGALGSLAGGVGAVPGAIEGAAAGFGLSATLLGCLGLTFLFIAVGQNLGEVAGRLTVAVRLAWDASDYPPEQRHEHVRRAGHILAEAMALLMLMILQAIVAWLLKKGLDKLPELVAELRSSKLGQGFAEWVEKNAAKLYDDPKLRPQQARSTTKAAAESEAQSPSQLARKNEESPPRPATRLVSSKEAEDLLVSHGLSPDRAKDYVASFEGPINVREVSPGETFLRYTDVADSKGSFLTKQVFGSPQEASQALYLEPYGNSASLVQPVTATRSSMVLEGAIANGMPPGTVQTLMMDRNAFVIGQGVSFP